MPTGDEHVDELAVLICGAKWVAPFSGDFDLRLVDEPACTDWAAGWTGGVDE